MNPVLLNGNQGSKLLIIVAFMSVLFLIIGGSLTHVTASSPNFEYISSYWGSETQPREVYPGSSNVKLIILVQYLGNKTLSNTIGILSLPQGVLTSNGEHKAVSQGFVKKNESSSVRVEPGDIIRYEYTLSITRNVLPGTYTSMFVINYTYIENGEVLRDSYILNVSLKISSLPSCYLDVIETYWTSNDGRLIDATPGTSGATLNIVLYNRGNNTIDEIRARLENEFPLVAQGGEEIASNIASGEKIVLSYTGVSVNHTAQPGYYPVRLDVRCRVSGYGGAVGYSGYFIKMPVQISSPPDAGLEVIKTSWKTETEEAYPGAQNAYLRITIRNMGSYSISNIIAYLYLPKDFRTIDNTSIVNTTLSDSLGHGDIGVLEFGPIRINSTIKPGAYYARLYINSIGSIGGTRILVNDYIVVPLRVQNYTAPIELISVEWSYDGEPAVCLPGAKNLNLVLTLANRAENRLSAINPIIILPEGMILRSIEGDLENVPPASIFRLIFIVDTDEKLKPGVYVANLTLRFNADPQQQSAITTYNLSVPLRVSNPSHIDTIIDVLDAYWGVNTPREVYPGSKLTPLTLRVLNRGHYSANSMYSEMIGNKYISQVSKGVATTPTLTPGTQAPLTMYVNISKDAPAGKFLLHIKIGYILEVYGALLTKSREYVIPLTISRPPATYGYLEVISVNWLNNYPVYPGTSDAILRIVIANKAPFAVSGIDIGFIGPRGIEIAEHGANYTYISGPIASWQTFTVDLHLRISKTLSPGTYNATLMLEYTLESGGGGIRLREKKSISVDIEKPVKPTFIGAYWYGRSPGPGSAGSLLLIVYQNTGIPVMKSLVACVSMPKGFILTSTGTSIGNVTPLTSTSFQQVENLISGTIYPLQTTSFQTEVGEGDFIIIPIGLIISNETRLGTHDFNITLYFRDQWDVDRVMSMNGAFMLHGTPLLEIVERKSRVILGARATEVSLYVKNNGTGPAYDVFVGITSISGAIAFSSSIKHVDIIMPGEEVCIKWIASASPSLTSSMSLPAIVFLSYTDPIGQRYSFNQTAILYVEGVIELKVTSIDVSPKRVIAGDIFDITATLVNTGTEKARNVEVYIEDNPYIKLLSDSYTFLGDVDPGTMIPVSVRAIAGNTTGSIHLSVIVRYYNAFNEEYILKKEINLTILSGVAGEETGGASSLLSYKTFTMLFVAVFLAISLTLIYKMYQRSKHAVQS